MEKIKFINVSDSSASFRIKDKIISLKKGQYFISNVMNRRDLKMPSSIRIVAVDNDEISGCYDIKPQTDQTDQTVQINQEQQGQEQPKKDDVNTNTNINNNISIKEIKYNETENKQPQENQENQLQISEKIEPSDTDSLTQTEPAEPAEQTENISSNDGLTDSETKKRQSKKRI